jgi:hypothetical protein
MQSQSYINIKALDGIKTHYPKDHLYRYYKIGKTYSYLDLISLYFNAQFKLSQIGY